MPLPFSEIFQKGFSRAGSVVLIKQVTHNGPQSGFLYHTMTEQHPILREHPYPYSVM
jgi:hypothetical protein